MGNTCSECRASNKQNQISHHPTPPQYKNPSHNSAIGTLKLDSENAHPSSSISIKDKASGTDKNGQTSRESLSKLPQGSNKNSSLKNSKNRQATQKSLGEDNNKAVALPQKPQAANAFSKKQVLKFSEEFLLDVYQRAAICKVRQMQFEEAEKLAVSLTCTQVRKSLDITANPEGLMRRQMRQNKLRVKRDSFVKIKRENINSKYQFKVKLGQGAFGCVFKVIQKNTKQERAIKIIKKRVLKGGAGDSIFAELEVLRTLDHPGIIKLFEVYQYRDFYYVVTEYCDGGEMFEAVKRADKFTQKIAANYMKQVLGAVNYMHLKNIVHRDLKPENIVFEYKKKPGDAKQPPLKIIDFGSATVCSPGCTLTSKVGSPYYVAPEVLGERYNNKCDIWSCGIIMYALLTGYPPFRGQTQEEIFTNIRNNQIDFDDRVWSKISGAAKDLIKQMLNKNPHKRISAEQALNHRWIQACENTEVIDEKVINNLEGFYFKNKFQAVVETFLASNTLSQAERRELAEKFREFDKDHSGVIEVDELVEAFQAIHGAANPEEIRDIVATIDTNGSGKIDFTQFIVATYERDKLMRKQSLERAFNFFDKDRTGYIEIGELRELMGTSSEVEVRQLMQQIDKNSDNKISLEEFVERLTDEKYMKKPQQKNTMVTH